MRKRTEGALKGAFFLTLSGLLVKLIGMIYKIPLTNRLGDTGMGYFNTAYTVYSFFFVLAGSGIPTALSLDIAKDLANGGEVAAEKRFRVFRRFGVLLALTLSLSLFLFAYPIAYAVGSFPAAKAIAAISPALCFITLSSVYRGYYQGQGYMLPTALSQLTEAVGKLLFGLLLLSVGLRVTASYDMLAALSLIGLSFATLLAFSVFLFFRKRKKEALPPFQKGERRALLTATVASAFPITVASLAASASSVIDLALLMRALASIGYSPDAANAAWGNYSSLVLPLFHMPQVLLTPIACAVLPPLKRALVQKDEDKAKSLATAALRLTALLAAVSALGLSLFSKEALSLIYRDEAAILRAYPHLALLSCAVFPLGIMTVSASLLQARGKLWFPTVSLTVGTLIKALITLFGVSLFGEAVAAFGTLLSYSVSASLNLAALSRAQGRSLWPIVTVKPFLTGALSVFFGLVIDRILIWLGLSERFATLIAITATAFLSLLIALLCGMIKKKELQALGMKIPISSIHNDKKLPQGG